VPLVDFDRLFGTWVEYKEYKLKEKKEVERKVKVGNLFLFWKKSIQ